MLINKGVIITQIATAMTGGSPEVVGPNLPGLEKAVELACGDYFSRVRNFNDDFGGRKEKSLAKRVERIINSKGSYDARVGALQEVIGKNIATYEAGKAAWIKSLQALADSTTTEFVGYVNNLWGEHHSGLDVSATDCNLKNDNYQVGKKVAAQARAAEARVNAARVKKEQEKLSRGLEDQMTPAARELFTEDKVIREGNNIEITVHAGRHDVTTRPNNRKSLRPGGDSAGGRGPREGSKSDVRRPYVGTSTGAAALGTAGENVVGVSGKTDLNVDNSVVDTNRSLQVPKLPDVEVQPLDELIRRGNETLAASGVLAGDTSGLNVALGLYAGGGLNYFNTESVSGSAGAILLGADLVAGNHTQYGIRGRVGIQLSLLNNLVDQGEPEVYNSSTTNLDSGFTSNFESVTTTSGNIDYSLAVNLGADMTVYRDSKFGVLMGVTLGLLPTEVSSRDEVAYNTVTTDPAGKKIDEYSPENVENVNVRENDPLNVLVGLQAEGSYEGFKLLVAGGGIMNPAELSGVGAYLGVLAGYDFNLGGD
jgi:hypothetical protein